MKRKIIASILGVAASSAIVASSYGQGQVIFSNYSAGESGSTASPASPITYGALSGGLNGTLVGSTFTAELLYTYPSQTAGLSAASLGGFATGYDYSQDGNGNEASATLANTGFPGYFVYAGPDGADVTIPGAATGTAVTFILYASGTFNAVNYVGESTPFTVTLVNPGGDLFNNGNETPGTFLPSVQVNPTPEPTTLALGGLGALGLLVIRRRK